MIWVSLTVSSAAMQADFFSPEENESDIMFEMLSYFGQCPCNLHNYCGSSCIIEGPYCDIMPFIMTNITNPLRTAAPKVFEI